MKLAPKLLLLPVLSSLAAAVTPLPGRASESITTGVVKRTLPNGLRVLVLRRATAPVVTTMMWYRVGSRDEVPGSTGMAHFLEHLLFKGTLRLKKGEIDRITYENGGSNNAFTTTDYTAYEFNFPKATWKAALRIEADRMRNCSFDRKEFDAEREVVMSERRGGQDDPAEQFGEQLNAVAYLIHPYRNPVIGWMEDLKRATRDQVYAFYRKYYVPANATLVITGDVSPGEALQAAETAFRTVPRLPAPERPVVEEPAQIAARRLQVFLAAQVPRVSISFHTPNRRSPDVFPLRLLDYVLSQGRLSRLYRRLVERDQLAADADASLSVDRDSGTFDLDANAKERVAPEQVEAALWEEIERVRREPVSELDLARAKNQFLSDWVHSLDTANELATVLGEADAQGGYEYLDGYLTRVQAVTPADLQRVARTYLQHEHSNVGYLIPIKSSGSPGGESAVGGHAGPRMAFRTLSSVPLGRRAAAFRTVRSADSPPDSAAPGAHAPKPVVAFAPLTPIERVLPNGMRLVLLENHAVPSVNLSARIEAGSFTESDAQSGLANLTARLLDEGTIRHDHREIAAALEQVGAEFGAAAGGATTFAELRTLTPHLASLLPLYAELLRTPSFPQDRVELERSRLLVAIREKQDDAGTVARDAFDDLIYAGHPAHRPVEGTEATVRPLTAADLQAFHRRFYRPDRVTLVAVGDFHPADLVRRLTELFGDWARPADSTVERLPSLRRQSDRRTRRISMDKTQTQIVLGHLGVTHANPDYLPLVVMDTILGEGVSGGFTARIPYQLRDVQGLAYSVGSSITGSAGKEPGVFAAGIGTEPSKEKAAVAALLAEIRRIRAAPVTEKELREAANYLAGSYVFNFQTAGQLADYLQSVQYYGLGWNYRQRFVEAVRRVTRADVQRVARKYLDPEHYTLVVAGPAMKSSPSHSGPADGVPKAR